VDELLFEKRGEDEACCETLIVGGIYSEFFLLEGEYDGKKKYIDVLLVGMACFVDIHINHKENECLIEEIGIEASFYENDCLFEDHSKVDEDHQDEVDETCLKVEAYVEGSVMEGTPYYNFVASCYGSQIFLKEEKSERGGETLMI